MSDLLLYAITHPRYISHAAAMGADFYTGTYTVYLRDTADLPRLFAL